MRFEILGSFSLCESSDSALRFQYIKYIVDGKPSTIYILILTKARTSV